RLIAERTGRLMALPTEILRRPSRAARLVAIWAGKRATVFDALASIAGNPAAMSAGKVRKDPPPATALIKPAAKAANTTSANIISFRLPASTWPSLKFRLRELKF